MASEDAQPSTERRFTVRQGAAADCDVAGRLHAGQITTGFLSLLGPPFLARLYRRVVQWDGGLLLVVVEHVGDAARPDDPVVGFLGAADPTRGLYREFLRRDAVAAAASTFWPLLRNWRRVLETLRHGSAESSGVGRGAELLAIAVAPGCQGQGLGRRLVTTFLEDVRARGGREAYTVTAADNEASQALYRACGFRAAEQFELHAGTTSLVMQWDLPSP